MSASAAIPQRHAVSARNRSWPIWLLQIIGNAVLLGLAWTWLYIPDETWWQLLLTFLVAACVTFGALWLHAGSMLFFSAEEISVRLAFRSVLARLPAFLLWIGIGIVLLWFVNRMADYIPAFSGWLFTKQPPFMRARVSPGELATVLEWVSWIIVWFVIPIMLLPFGFESAHRGIRAFSAAGLRVGWKAVWRRTYWAVYLVFFAIGIYIPYRIIWWLPDMETMAGEFLSMAIRFGLAYLLSVSAWLLLLRVAGHSIENPSMRRLSPLP
jgi:hypothetical protein